MFAIRSLRSAAGATVDGIFYPAHSWTLAPEMTVALKNASEATPGSAAGPVKMRPVLEIIEVSGKGDKQIKERGLPVISATAANAPAVDIVPDTPPATE